MKEGHGPLEALSSAIVKNKLGSSSLSSLLTVGKNKTIYNPKYLAENRPCAQQFRTGHIYMIHARLNNTEKYCHDSKNK